MSESFAHIQDFHLPLKLVKARCDLDPQDSDIPRIFP